MISDSLRSADNKLENLFLSCVSYIGESFELTRLDCWRFLKNYFTEEAWQRYSNVVYLYSREQIEAEKAMEQLLQSVFYRIKRVTSSSNRICRNTDWGRTYSKKSIMIPTSYMNRIGQEQVDTELLSALVSISKGWLDLLGCQDGKCSFRYNQLHETIKKLISNQLIVPMAPRLTQSIFMRLKWLYPEHADTLLLAMRYWVAPFTKTDMHNALKLLCFFQSEKGAFQNDNIVLEVVVTILILQVSVACGWTIDYQNSTHFFSELSIPAFKLKKGENRLTIGKGDKKLAGNDQLSYLREYIGQNVRGNQPDIMLTFIKDNREVVIPCDAKNNSTEAYIGSAFDAALTYAISFGGSAGLSLSYNHNNEITVSSKVMPLVTLFFADVLDPLRYNEKKIANEQIFITGLGLNQIVNNHGAPKDELIDWFGSIEKQAVHRLEEGWSVSLP